MIIGSVAGAISVIGFTIIQPKMQRLTGGVDTAGVHNLHGMPGVFGGLIAMALVAFPLWQLTGIVITVFFAVIMGVIVGFIVSKLGIRETPYNHRDNFYNSDDNEE
jgi:ammonium transporter Rh